MMIVFVVYKVFDNTKISNEKFVNILDNKLKNKDMKKVIYEDIMEKIGDFELSKNRNINSDIIAFKTKNTYYGSFNNYICYILIEGNLLRIESSKKLDIKNLTYDMFDDSYIDIVFLDIKNFQVDIKEDRTLFFIENNKNEVEVLNVFKMD